MKHSVFRLFTILLFATFALYSCVLVPVYQIIASDFVLADTLWFDVIDLLVQWVEIFGSAVLFAFLVFGIYCLQLKGCKKLFCLLGGALLFKYIGAFLSISIVYGTIDFTYDYSGYIVALLIEVALAALLTYLAGKCISSHNAKSKATQNAANTLGVEVAPAAPLLPFSGLFDAKNPLQRSVMIAMGTFTLLRLLSFIISDIAFSLSGVLFSAADIPVMLLYWLILILLPCFAAYCLICLLLRFAARKQAR